MLLEVVKLYRQQSSYTIIEPAHMELAEPTIAEIGTNIMTSYILPFEYISLVLLAVVIGAAILVRESRDRNLDPDPDPDPEPAEEKGEVAT